MIRLENLSKYYSGGSGITVGLDRVSLELKKGEFVAITGESGSGKSTLLRVLGGTDSYEEGEFWFRGKPTSDYSAEDWENYRNKEIAVIYQDYRLIDSYTVLQNVECALIIRAVPSKERKRLALQYLEEVGLADLYRKKAANLSSGQRQRLSIARALAKNTDIIVADEPTGNLDSENGAAVMELLYRLSAKKLVVVVTHNYEQAAPYATRKIRLHDGTVTEDRQVNPPCLEMADTESTDTESTAAEGTAVEDADAKENGPQTGEEQGKEKSHTVRELLRFNRSAQPRRYLLLGIFLLGISLGFAILTGGIIGQLDKASSKIYEDHGFPNGDKTRLIVQKRDQSAVENTDLEAIAGVEHVKQADRYGAAGDIAVYYGENQGYKKVFRVCESDYEMPDAQYMKMLDSSCYLRSAACLSEDKMKEGQLPVGYYEAAVSEGCGLRIGETVPFYLVDTKRWTAAWMGVTDELISNTGPNYVCAQMKITGIVEGEEPQVYFSDEYVKYLTADDGRINHFLYYYLENYWDLGQGVNRNTRGVKDISAAYQNQISLMTGVKMDGEPDRQEAVLADVSNAAVKGALSRYLEYLKEKGKRDLSQGNQNYWAETVMKYYDGIPSADGKISDILTEALVDTDSKSIAYRRQNAIYLYNPELKGNFVRLSAAYYDNNIIVADGHGYGYGTSGIVSQYAVYPLVTLAWQPDQNQERNGRVKKQYVAGQIADVTDYGGTPSMIGLTIDPTETAHGVNIYEVSKEVFEQICPELDSEEMSVYIEDYAYTDDVIADLEAMGYEAISVFRTGAVSYDMETVRDMLVTVGICAGVLAAIFILGVVLQYAVWTLRRQDYLTMKLLGLRQKTMKALFYADTGCMTAAAMIMAWVILQILQICGVGAVYDLMKYYRWYHYLLLAVLHGVFAVITVFFMNRSMKKKLVKLNG